MFNQTGYSAGIIVWNIKPFPAPSFNHLIQPSPPLVAELKFLQGVSRGQLPP